ncbi:MAG: GNAT family N-acetyltransferase, partial [Acidimicrobiales bacterium]
MSGGPSTRDVLLPQDASFLLSIYASTRALEVEVLARSQRDADAFVRMQFEAQTRHFAAIYPRATHSVISVGGDPAGRLIVDRPGDEIRIVEIALLPRFRRAGVGGQLVSQLFEEADAAGLPVRCHVAQDNEALAFWERLGLVRRAVDGAHVM